MKLNPVPKLKQFSEDSNRIIGVMYKPGVAEFKRTLKIVLFGTLLLGAMGFIISIIIGLIV